MIHMNNTKTKTTNAGLPVVSISTNDVDVKNDIEVRM